MEEVSPMMLEVREAEELRPMISDTKDNIRLREGTEELKKILESPIAEPLDFGADEIQSPRFGSEPKDFLEMFEKIQNHQDLSKAIFANKTFDLGDLGEETVEEAMVQIPKDEKRK